MSFFSFTSKIIDSFMNENRKILVTGGTGYIGSHTVVELMQEGYDVHIIDNLSNSDETMIDRIEAITGKRPQFTNLDIRDKDGLHAFFEVESDFSGVIHFAALKSVGESVNMPLAYYENNILGLINILEVLKKHEIRNFVFSSSCTVYGVPKELPVTESCAIGFTPSPYGATKQMSERILEDFSHANSLANIISLRYFNPIGAHDSGLIGELPTGIPNNLMPFITQTAAGIREKLSVFGSDYNTHDGTAIRDYIHVSDLAKAHVKALDFLTKESPSTHIKVNVGNGKGYSVLDVIHSFEKTSGIKIKYEMADRREGDVESIYADPTYAEEFLGWKAKFDIDDMTSSAWNWEKKLRNIS